MSADVAALFERHYPSLKRRALRVLQDEGHAEEAVMDVFARIIARPPRHWESEAAYLGVSVSNRCRDQLRRDASKPPPLELLSDPPCAEPTPDTRLDLHAALRCLPRHERDCLVLHYLSDLPCAEVARLTKTSVNTVKARLRRGRARLSGVLTA